MAIADRGWTEENLPDQAGKTFVVTGANSGLGLETTKALAGRGARVIMACRRIEAGTQAAAQVAERSPDAQLEVEELDLGNLASVRAFAERMQVHPKIDVLINNAGVMALPRGETLDGFERQFGINHLGHFALTGLLLPKLLAADDARVVSVSSDVHRIGRIRFDDLHGQRRYWRWPAYGQSKLANLLFSNELGRRAAAAGAGLRSLAAHPGFAATNLQSQAARDLGREGRSWRPTMRFAQSAADGALPQLRAATDPDAVSGTYFGPLRGKTGPAVVVESNKRSHDVAVAGRLWDVSSGLTGVVYEF